MWYVFGGGDLCTVECTCSHSSTPAQDNLDEDKAPEGFVLQGDIPQAAYADDAGQQHAATADTADDIVALADTSKKRARAAENGNAAKRARQAVDGDDVVVLDD